jgi:calcineurin-like phosphoesterase family protein
MANVFFTADTHFGCEGHRKYFKRPFPDVVEMQKALIKNWNKVVEKEDVVYHLGDFGIENTLHAIFRKLNGQKILVEGDHDAEPVVYLPWAKVVKSISVSVEGQELWLTHKPHKGWIGQDRGVWHLHGHSHGRRSPRPQTLDVGVECWDFRPIIFAEIRKRVELLQGSSRSTSAT